MCVCAIRYRSVRMLRLLIAFPAVNSLPGSAIKTKIPTDAGEKSGRWDINRTGNQYIYLYGTIKRFWAKFDWPYVMIASALIFTISVKISTLKRFCNKENCRCIAIKYNLWRTVCGIFKQFFRNRTNVIHTKPNENYRKFKKKK